ncbi:MAG TPA: hypothetical protein VGC70_01340 [Burkholderiales bacterium]
MSSRAHDCGGQEKQMRRPKPDKFHDVSPPDDVTKSALIASSLFCFSASAREADKNATTVAADLAKNGFELGVADAQRRIVNHRGNLLN